MNSLKDIINSGAYDGHLQRRQKLWASIREAYRDDPEGAERVLAVVGEVHARGKIARFWDFVAALAGSDRGWGNSTFLDAIQLFEEMKTAKPLAVSPNLTGAERGTD